MGLYSGVKQWKRTQYAKLVFAWLTFSAGSVFAQTTAAAPSWLTPLPQFPLSSSELTIRQHAESGKPFTVAGQCGAFMGEQNGSFEAWIFPVKLLSHFTIAAAVEGYPVPIDLNADAAEIEVTPDRTIITYSHIAFTVREILLAPRCTSAAQPGPAATSAPVTSAKVTSAEVTPGAGVIALFQIESTRPVTLTFSFTPEVRRMWPASNYGPPSPEWVGTATAGYYLLHEDFPDLAAAIAMPGTHPGILAPYQEKPKVYPLQLVLNFDPKRDSGKYFPLTMAVGTTPSTATTASLVTRLGELNTSAKELFESTANYYAHYFDKKLTIETPDPQLDAAIKWAEISIDQVQVRHGDEVGLVAGFYSSGDSARPGFGWYFGRDTLYTLYAVNSYGDFRLTREALDFLIRRQRADGKMPHEWSQTADLVDWASFPYEYAAADATPLFLMAVEDYVDASGDLDYLRRNWPAVQKAWDFERTHDSDGDGIYDNAQGTGWVESWPPGMPHQEIYLASLDQQASGAMGRLSLLMADSATAESAAARAASVAAKIEQEYSGSMYAFSIDTKGARDNTATIYPAIAWWDGHSSLHQPDAMFRRWASHEFSTDWGTRDLGEQESLYDPISYHQGSVWPLFTGWASVAEYRTGRSLSGYAHLMQNAELTWQQDLGAVTELLSGAYFAPFGRSTTHQMWSSAMVVTPAIRGLFGISRDALNNKLIVDPHLPAEWDHAALHNLAVGSQLVDITLQREGASLTVRMSRSSPQIALSTQIAAIAGAKAQIGPTGEAVLKLPLPEVEIGIPATLPLPGAATAQIKVLSERHEANSIDLQLEAQAGSTYDLPLRLNGHPELARKMRVEGAAVLPPTATPQLQKLRVVFPSGQGYRQATVHIIW